MSNVAPASKLWAAPVWRVTSLSPFIVDVGARVLIRTFFDPMYSTPPDILGVPLGVVLEAIAWIWAGIGAVLIWRTSSSAVAAVALFVFTLPSLVAVIFGPALILIMQNLGT